ncbi:MAG TPA: bifunctional phosphoribosyl-AMP cyclohydrolase/phosphoribosyl-ATP diphosphatase HisIE [Sandaracinaceae bacterium]
MELPPLKLDRDGLVTVVAQDRASGEVRMVAHANEEALRRTAETGLAHFYSRSRKRLWCKGEESGNTLAVSAIWLDCDADAAIYLVAPRGPTCHTGRPSCFFVRAHGGGEAARALPVLAELEAVLEARRGADAGASYTRALLDGGAPKIGAKIREEAAELAEAIAGESDARVVAEAADLVYHAMVGLISRGLSLRDVQVALSERFGVSGHEEKASR